MNEIDSVKHRTAIPRELRRAVLFTDDHKLRNSFERSLSDRGFDVSSFRSVGEHAETADDVVFDIAVMDVCGSPQTKLSSFNTWIQNGGAPYGIVVGSAEKPETIISALRAGADDFLAKPIETDALSDAIDRAVLAIENGNEYVDRTNHLKEQLDREIFKRRQVETELRDSTERFRMLAEAASDWFWEMDENLRFSYLSPGFFLNFDIAPENILGKTRREFADTLGITEQPAAWDAHFSDLEAHRPFRNFEYAYTDSSGREVEVSISGFPIFDDGGRFLGYRGTSANLSHRRKAEQKLAEQWRQTQLLHRISAAANEAESIEAACSIAIEEICNVTRWPVGHLWLGTPEEPEVVTSSGVWHGDDRVAATNFFEIASEITLKPGTGLAGKALEDGGIQWNLGIDEDFTFKRSKAARDAGLKIGCAFPISVDYTVVGVMEFFSREEMTESIEMIQAFEIGANQIARVVERKWAERRLQDSEVRFRKLYNSSPVMMHTLDAKGRITEVNDVWLISLGYSRTEVLGRKVTDFLTDESEKLAKEVVIPMLYKKRVSGNNPYQMIAKNGKVIDLLMSTAADFDDAGNFLRTRSVFIDVTERNRIANELAETEAQLRNVLESSPVGISIVSPKSNARLYVNSRLAEMFGATDVETFMSMPIADSFANPADMIRLRDSTNKGGFIREAEVLRKRIDGSTWWCLTNRREITYDGHDAIIVWHYDITARKETESALRENEQRFRQIFEHAPIGMALITPEGQRVAVNQALADFLGYSLDEITGTEMKATAGDMKQLDRSMKLRQRVMDGEMTTYTNERRYRRKDGTFVWGEVTGSLVRDEDDRPLYFIAHTRDITDRKRLEEELREGQDRFRDFAEATADWYWETDEELRFSFLSERFTEVTGRSPEAILGKRRDELEDFEKDNDEFQRLLDDMDNRRPFRNVVRRGIDPDGAPIWVAISGKPVFDKDENFFGYRGTAIDVTARVLIEQGLKESEQRFQLLAASSPAGVFYTDGRGKCLFVNNTWSRFTGMEPADATGAPWFTAIADEQVAKVEQIWLACQGAGLRFEEEVQFTRKDGTTLWANVQATPHLKDDGSVMGYLGTAISIEDRKSVELELMETEARSSAILDNAPVAIYVKDTDGRYLQVNRRFGELFGDPEDIVGRSVTDILPQELSDSPEVVQQVLANIAEPVETERTINIDGKDRTFLTTKFPLFDTDGQPYALCGISADITDRKATEAQLAHSSKMATIGQMSASMAHELSQPLHIIALTVDNEIVSLEEDHVQPEDILESLKAVDNQCRRMATTISHMSVFSRTDEGDGEVFPIVAALSGAAELLRKSFAADGIRIIQDIPENCGRVFGHRAQLEQVLINLLSNARDATNERRGDADDSGQENWTVELSCALMNAGDAVEIRISDQAGGISDGAMQDIFEPFYTTKASGEGTGLGLAISMDIVNSMKGAIRAENVEGGARFTITLPLHHELIDDVELEVDLHEEPAEPIVVETPGPLARLMVVDDERAAARHLSRHLERKNYEVVTAFGGDRAFEAFQASPVDLLITDLRMPRGDGASLISKIRADSPELPIIIVTGDLDAAETGAKAGGDGPISIMRKPVDLKTLMKTVNEFLAAGLGSD